MWLADKTSGNWPVIIPSAAAAAMVVPGIILAGLGDSTAGAPLIACPLMLYVPYLAGFILGVRKRRIPLQKAIYEIHEHTSQMAAEISRGHEPPAVYEPLRLVGGDGT